jgi:hypothetical protein
VRRAERKRKEIEMCHQEERGKRYSLHYSEQQKQQQLGWD